MYDAEYALENVIVIFIIILFLIFNFLFFFLLSRHLSKIS